MRQPLSSDLPPPVTCEPSSRPNAKRYNPSIGMPSPSSSTALRPSLKSTRFTTTYSPSSKSGFGVPWLYGLSKSTSTTTICTVSSVRPGLMHTCLETFGTTRHFSPTYPVSSLNSRSAQSSGLSPSSISPAGNSTVVRPTGGRNCSTSTVSILSPSLCSLLRKRGIITTASALLADRLVVLVATSHLRDFPSLSVYERVWRESHLVEATGVTESILGTGAVCLSLLSSPLLSLIVIDTKK
mmetsp:Transcript_28462/g.42261  ORF Transcript_28462/g.42261 Transcript_28462/m.42261 type:complete len:240 (+) Transcript_28462:513-1232(+)